MQGEFGNISGDKPSVIDAMGYLKWETWKSVEGMAKEEAQKKFIAHAVQWLKDHNREDLIEDPEKTIIEKRYKNCIALALKDGKSLKEIEQERLAFIQLNNKLNDKGNKVWDPNQVKTDYRP